jgi:hypothetical protein
MRGEDAEGKEIKMNEMHISNKLAVILQMRIYKAINKARYYPAECQDMEALAYEVVRPYLKPNSRSESNKAMLPEGVK